MKNDLNHMTDEELEETYRREVMTYQIEEVRREKRYRKFRWWGIILVIAIVFIMLCIASKDLNMVGMY